ncbi:uncharacterized protein [Antedon mediterranea]|uniref:uncharacterized protein n=1 Tax=Antedon mediterranea TaxID=105859 RepID=UPI003AF7C0B4
MRCQHNTRSSKPKPGKGTKNTGCPATMNLVLKRSITNSKTQDQHVKHGLLFNVRLKNEHNHRITCADALRRRDVSEDSIAKLRDLFEHGHSPSSALETIKHDLAEEHGEQYVYVCADRFMCSDLQFCYRLYYKTFQKVYGASSGELMYVDLEKRVHEYNAQQNDSCAKMCTTDDNQTIIAICTPLMKRVHTKVKHSGEMIFVDSSGNCDRHNSRIFIFLTHSSAGGLPLGVVITTSESEATITTGIKLLQTILPDGSYFGRGAQGPQIAMTDDCQALHLAIHAVYPETSLLLCVFHLLQAMWRWLWDAKNRIAKCDRPSLLGVLKSLVYAESARELNERYEVVTEDPAARKYHKYREHLDSIYQRKEAWAICLRSNLMTRGNNTNNYVESAMRVVKDKVLYRLKAYNVTQLMDFILTRMESYYARRLLDVANNRTANIQQSRYFMSDGNINCDNILKEDESNYSVPSASTDKLYHVDISIGTCTCPIGNTGGPCKHQNAVMKTFNIINSNHTPTTSPFLRKLYYSIATGRDDIDRHWLMGLEYDEPDAILPDENTAATTGSGQSVLQDPQIVRLDSLNLQRSAENAFQNRGRCTEATDDDQTDDQERLKLMFEKLSKAVNEHSDVYKAPIRKFMSAFDNITTDAALVSALATFGNYNGHSAARQIKIRAKKCLQTTTKIGVQPTAIARRRVPLEGRRALITGRPPKQVNQSDNGYAKKRGSTTKRGVIPRRRASAPHSLSQCVTNNASLGQTHSTK